MLTLAPVSTTIVAGDACAAHCSGEITGVGGAATNQLIKSTLPPKRQGKHYGGSHRHTSEDKKILHGMGYAQELSRSMSKFSNFAISFSIICILSGGINSFAQATSSIGGAGAGLGWLFGCIVSGMFALAMAQISSAYPTAGGLYHWASILGNTFWGWLTAWLNFLRAYYCSRCHQHRHGILLCWYFRWPCLVLTGNAGTNGKLCGPHYHCASHPQSLRH